MAGANVDLEYLASLWPPINIFPISDTDDSIKSRATILEKYYNEYYADDGNIPYYAKMARRMSENDVSDASRHVKKRSIANLSRLSRDKVRFVTARTADDTQILSTIFASKLDYIIALEKEINDVLIENGDDPVNIIELFDIDEDSRKSNVIPFNKLFLELENVFSPTKCELNTSHLPDELQGEQTEPIDYSISSHTSLHRPSSETEHQLASTSSESYVTDTVNSAAVECALQKYLTMAERFKYSPAMKVNDNQPDEYGLILGFCAQMVNSHMASLEK